VFLMNIPITNPTSLIVPINNFPVFLLVLKENLLVIKILSYFYNNTWTGVWLTSYIKASQCISYLS